MADVDMAVWAPSTPGAPWHGDAARGEAWATSSGDRGVRGRPGSLKVSIAPDGMIQVAPGAAVSPSPYTGHESQSYSMYCYTPQKVPGIPTGSSGSRTDAVIIRVDDPSVAPNRRDLTLQEAAAHPYARIEVIQGVPAGLRYAVELIAAKGLDYPFVLLARLAVPANNASTNMSGATLTDLRDLVGALTLEVPTRVQQISSGQVEVTSTAAWPEGMPFPHLGTTSAGWRTHRVPEWATHAKVRCEWLGIRIPAGSGSGQVWVTYGLADTDTDGRTEVTPWAAEDTIGRQNLVNIGTVAIPSRLRGRDVRFVPRARRATTSTPAIRLDQWSVLALDVKFTQSAE